MNVKTNFVPMHLEGIKFLHVTSHLLLKHMWTRNQIPYLVFFTFPRLSSTSSGMIERGFISFRVELCTLKKCLHLLYLFWCIYMNIAMVNNDNNNSKSLLLI